MLIDNVNLDKLIYLVLRGGWPENIGKSERQALNIAKDYMKNVIESDINYDGINRNQSKMEKLIKSLARNECTLVNNSTIIKDIEENQNDTIHRDTITDYMNILKQLFILEEVPAFSTNVRSSKRIKHTSKKRLVDPSLSCSILNLSFDQAKGDLRTFGFLFESMCTRDLQIYAQSLGGNIYHYSDNTGLEIDNIIELPGGKYGAFEIKLGTDEIEKAAQNLLKFKSIIDNNKPSVLCVIVGDCTNAYLRDDGVYVLPITALKQ